uniref:Uncharacterized protein n=1 Tax=Steinernema glaseri TaxID=37863 RepID=A0A1I7ZPF4_9BILA
MASASAVLSVAAVSVGFSGATLTLQWLLFKMKSLGERWKESSPLTLLFLSNVAASLVYIFVSLQWSLVALGLISNAVSTLAFHLPVALAYSFTAFHDFATVGLFLQRIYFLLVPMVNAKRLNRAISRAVLLGTALLTVIETALHTALSGSPSKALNGNAWKFQKGLEKPN